MPERKIVHTNFMDARTAEFESADLITESTINESVLNLRAKIHRQTLKQLISHQRAFCNII